MAESLIITLSIQDDADLTGLFTIHSAADGCNKLGAQPSGLVSSLVAQIEKCLKAKCSPEEWNAYQEQLKQQYEKLAADGAVSINQHTGRPELNLKFQ